MFEIITKWNLTQPNSLIDDFVDEITLRGYNADGSYIPGEFATLLAEKKVRALSVGDIADKICPTKRDLYFRKGINRVKAPDQKTWGRQVGKTVEQYFYDLFSSQIDIFSTNRTFWQKVFLQHPLKNYQELISDSDNFYELYKHSNEERINALKQAEATSVGSQEGDTDWLLKLLNSSGRAELAMNLLHRVLNRPSFIDVGDVSIETDIHPTLLEIGINDPTSPDFIIPKFSIVGDVKTGAQFELKYQLTCTGYALAYENETGRDINWGIIYFIPTRVSYQYARVFNYPQIHIFPINEKLRQWFLDTRDESYNLISQNNVPVFPNENERNQCPYCKYKDHCVQQGLILE